MTTNEAAKVFYRYRTAFMEAMWGSDAGFYVLRAIQKVCTEREIYTVGDFDLDLVELICSGISISPSKHFKLLEESEQYRILYTKASEHGWGYCVVNYAEIELQDFTENQIKKLTDDIEVLLHQKIRDGESVFIKAIQIDRDLAMLYIKAAELGIGEIVGGYIKCETYNRTVLSGNPIESAYLGDLKHQINLTLDKIELRNMASKWRKK